MIDSFGLHKTGFECTRLTNADLKNVKSKLIHCDLSEREIAKFFKEKFLK